MEGTRWRTSECHSIDADPDADVLTGIDVERVLVNEEWLIFTGGGEGVALVVEGDCCSTSYWHDIIGVDKLLSGGPIISAEWIDFEVVENDGVEEIKAWGLRIVTEGPFGEWTTAASIRNRSNGYYGGWAAAVVATNTGLLINLTADCVDVPDLLAAEDA